MKKNYLLQKTEFALGLFFKQKYILLLAALTLFPGNYTTAQTAGPNNAGTGANNATTGTIGWTVPGNITAADGISATAAVTNGAFTNYIQGTNYGFSIPTGAVIDGIEVIINRKTSSTAGGRFMSDNIVRLVKGGTILGNNKALPAVGYTTVLTTATYGSPTDKWGLTWLASDINANNFGAVLSVTANSSITASVDYIQIKVYYTPAPTISSFSATNACIGSTPSIVITGNHFSTVTNVSFNGVSASFTVNSNTQITAILPVGATTGTITVTSPSGTGTSASNFTVNPLPVLNPITGSTSICIGSTTTLSNSTPGGSWNSTSTGVATINSSGVVSSVSAGTSLVTYTYTNGNGCTNSVNTTVTVNALPVVSSPASVCLGDTIQLAPSSGGTWSSSDTTKATVDNTGLVTGVGVGSATFTYTDLTTNCSKTTNVLNILALPAISLQPTTTQTICSGNSVSFSVNATGAGLTYQWYNGATPLSNGGAISGATSATLTINPVALSHAGTNYNCVVTGSCTPSVTSNNAELIVTEKVIITSQPAATQTSCTGNTVNFSVTATGDGLTYQWYKGAIALADSAAISGATTSSLTLSSLALADAGTNYYCLVSGTSPCSAVASSNAALIVNQSISITSQPAVTQTVCSAGSASFTVAATGTGLSYQWYKGATLLTNGGGISGATSATLTINPVSLSHAGTNYNCVVSGSCTPSVTSNNAELIVTEKVTITSQPAATQTSCTGNTVNFSITATGDGLTYQWYKGATALVDSATISGATTSTLTLSALTLSDAGANYYCLVSGTSPCSAVASSNAALIVNQSISITSQPAVTQTVCSAGSASFTVAATGTALTYQWYKGATLLSNGGGISGATSATLTINPVSLSHAGTNYNCVISGSCTPSVTSNNAELIVKEKVTITSQPAATQTSCTGNTVNFSVIATGDGLTYQWYKGATALVDSATISGATTSTLTLSSLTLSDAGANYYCLVSGTSPCSSVASANATLIVNQSISITSQPAVTQTVCSAGSASFTVAATGTALTYQWYKGVTLLSNGGGISGATSATLTINPVALSHAGTNYNCVVSGSCTPSVTSNNAELIVTEKVTITSQPAATQTSCTGNTVNFSVTATGDGLTYQWYKGVTALVDSATISGATTSTLTLNSLTLSDAGTNYYCLVSGTSPCNAVASANAILIVNLNASITSQPTATQSVCEGTSVSFAVTAVGTGITYQWYKGTTLLSNGSGISGATTATLTINPVALSHAGTNYNCVVTNVCSNTTSNNAELIVNPKAFIPNQTVTVCNQNTFTVTPTNGLPTAATVVPANTTYSWFAPSVTGGITGGVAQTGQTSISGNLTNPTNVNQTATYTVTPITGSSPNCNGATFTVTVTVKPSATIANTTTTTCSAVSFTVTPSNGGGNIIPAGTTYSWGLPTVTGGITGATTGSAQTSIIQTLTNPTTIPQTATYIITPASGSSPSCSGAAFTLVVTVNPKSFIPNQTVTVCNQNAFTVTPTNGVPTSATVVAANTTYSWSAPSVTGGITGGSAQSGQNSIFGNLTNPTNSNQTATYTVTPTSGSSPSCNGGTFTVTVTVKPSATIVSQTTSTCSGASFAFTPANGGGNVIPSGTTYSWGLPTVTGGITGATTGSTQTSISQTLTNPTSANQTATYTITTDANGCAGPTFTLVVTVYPTPVASVNVTSQTACSGIAFSNISLTNSVNSATTYNWTRDNTTNVTGATSGTSGTIAAGGTFSLSQILTINTTTAQSVIYTFTPTSNGCVGGPITSTVILDVPAVGGTASSSLPGVTPVVRTVTECHFATGTVYLSGHVGNVVGWEYSTTGGNTWLPIANTSTSYTYTNIVASTIFRAIIQNGSTCNLAYSLVTRVNVIPNIKPSPVTATPQTICVGDSSNLYSESGFATSSYLATGGTFSNANPANWSVDGCGNCLSAGASNTNPGPFQLSATNGGTYSGINYTSSGKFAIANGNYNSIMQTPIFNTFGLTTATLNFNHAFNLQAGASVSIQLSFDGGATYTTVLAQYSGPLTRTPYTAFPLESIDLSNYIGESNLRIRFVYTGTVNSSWAIDNIIIPEAPSNLTTEWIDSLTGEVLSTSATLVVSPTVTTTYGIVSHLNGCTSFGPDGTTYITVTVNQRPTANIGPSQTVCNGGTATFSVALTGTAPWSVTYSNGTSTTTVNNVNTNPYVFNVTGVAANQTYTITALSDSKCTAKPQDLTGSAVVTVLNGVAGLWTGLVSNDWFDCKNWAGGLPSATVNAQIPTGLSRYPIIDPSTSTYAALYSNIASAQDVLIANGASVTMATNSNLYVSRDWKNSGTFTPGQGTVTFNGSTLNQVQTINVGIKTNEAFYNLTLNNSNSAKGISVVDGFELTVANNLSLLSGDLRLVGEAQLVQNGTAANPSSGTGKILIDQQGNRSSYHYNYWTSPVTTNGINYSLSGVLRDGTDSATNLFNPSPITFGAGAYFADGAITTPVKISTRWLYKYTSVSSTYAGWQAIGETGTANIGEGFTMKGVTGIAPFTTPQNYVFVGKPNNGTIPLSISLNQSYLVGNPYPCALDADEFIKDNIKDGAGRAATNIFNGALYFWDHFGGQTHILNEYIGGYSSYTLMGGVVAISNDPLVNADGSMGTKVPKRYIPVAQGFFIGTGSNSALTGNNPGLSTPVTGGTINFKNSQRAFKVESSGNSVFFKSNNQNQTVNNDVDSRQKIRLLYQSPSNIYRQILVGVDENATSFFDIGYDAPIIDENAEDLYWKISDAKLTIQAVSDFNQEQVLPLGLKTSTAGMCTIKVDTLENISEDTQLYIHDAETGIDYDIKNSDFTISLPIGIYNDRFSLRFTSQSLGLNPHNQNEPLLFFTNGNNTLNIKNTSEIRIKTVKLYNILGQFLFENKLDNLDLDTIEISYKNLKSGTYIVKAITEENRIFCKKIQKK